MAVVYLITRVKQKDESPGARPARYLYISPLFRKMRAVAERDADRWYILSDHYGLLKPDDEVEWYEVDLKEMGRADRANWAVRVLAALEEELREDDEIVMLAGSVYVNLLKEGLQRRGFSVDDPMCGLRIGERMAWLDAQLYR
jgi:cytoplasmic iron level regulating protein YaaA (DUF328/UPF0246 family)